MRDFLFIESEDPSYKVDEKYIAEVEERYSFEFPDILREYYLQYNGSEMYEVRFDMYNVEFCVVFFYDLRYGKMPIEKVLEYNKKNESIPHTFVPLAQDEDTDDFYWDSESGKVYFLSLSNVEHPKVICESVDDFFKLMNSSVDNISPF